MTLNDLKQLRLLIRERIRQFEAAEKVVLLLMEDWTSAVAILPTLKLDPVTPAASPAATAPEPVALLNGKVVSIQRTVRGADLDEDEDEDDSDLEDDSDSDLSREEEDDEDEEDSEVEEEDRTALDEAPRSGKAHARRPSRAEPITESRVHQLIEAAAEAVAKAGNMTHIQLRQLLQREYNLDWRNADSTIGLAEEEGRIKETLIEGTRSYVALTSGTPAGAG